MAAQIDRGDAGKSSLLARGGAAAGRFTLDAVIPIVEIQAREYLGREGLTAGMSQRIRTVATRGVGIALAGLAAWPASAVAAPIDRVSDHVALRAFDRYLKATLASMPAANARIKLMFGRSEPGVGMCSRRWARSRRAP